VNRKTFVTGENLAPAATPRQSALAMEANLLAPDERQQATQSRGGESVAAQKSKTVRAGESLETQGCEQSAEVATALEERSTATAPIEPGIGDIEKKELPLQGQQVPGEQLTMSHTSIVEANEKLAQVANQLSSEARTLCFSQHLIQWLAWQLLEDQDRLTIDTLGHRNHLGSGQFAVRQLGQYATFSGRSGPSWGVPVVLAVQSGAPWSAPAPYLSTTVAPYKFAGAIVCLQRAL
jgi:hypothetical protein